MGPDEEEDKGVETSTRVVSGSIGSSLRPLLWWEVSQWFSTLKTTNVRWVS